MDKNVLTFIYRPLGPLKQQGLIDYERKLERDHEPLGPGWNGTKRAQGLEKVIRRPVLLKDYDDMLNLRRKSGLLRLPNFG